MNYLLEILFGVFTIFLLALMGNDDEEENKLPQNDSITITLEELDGIYYAWEKEQNKFLIQSKQVDEIIEHIKRIFPGKNFTIISNKEIEWLRNQTNQT